MTFATFISYAREDLFISERVRAELEQHHLPCFQDFKTIRPGESFRQEIEAGIQSSRTLIVLLSLHSISSDEVLKEVKRAHELKVPIIPVVLDRKAVEKPSGLLTEVADLQWIVLQGPNNRPTSLQPVVRAVRRRWNPTTPVIAFSNLKGGVGKTTLAAHLSSCLGQLNELSILMIDLDPQSNLSQFVLTQERWEDLIQHDKSVLSLFEKSLVYGRATPRQSLLQVNAELIEEPNVFGVCEEVEGTEFGHLVHGGEKKPVFIIPGQFELVKYTLPVNAGSLGVLKENFTRSIEAAKREFDAIIIDLNPSSSFMIQCALTVATHVVCPIKPDKYSVQGLSSLRALIDKAFGLSKPPEIIPIFNGVPNWEDDFVRKIGEAISVPESLRVLLADEKNGHAVGAIAAVLSDPQRSRSVIHTHIPETDMLKAYQQAQAGGFFTMARFQRRGSFGARLGQRLMSAAKEIARITKADPLDVDTSYRLAQEAKTNR